MPPPQSQPAGLSVWGLAVCRQSVAAQSPGPNPELQKSSVTSLCEGPHYEDPASVVWLFGARTVVLSLVRSILTLNSKPTASTRPRCLKAASKDVPHRDVPKADSCG